MDKPTNIAEEILNEWPENENTSLVTAHHNQREWLGIAQAILEALVDAPEKSGDLLPQLRHVEKAIAKAAIIAVENIDEIKKQLL